MDTLVYISQAPYFWGTMGFITAMAMFIGVILYDGKMKEVSKALVCVGSYAALLTWINLIRISHVGVKNWAQAYAGVATIILVTFCWLLGMFLGVLLANLKGWKK